VRQTSTSAYLKCTPAVVTSVSKERKGEIVRGIRKPGAKTMRIRSVITRLGTAVIIEDIHFVRTVVGIAGSKRRRDLPVVDRSQIERNLPAPTWRTRIP
jgi:hypothetical protein